MSCQICFMAYTSGESHRITSLKCGHIFGKSCLERWMKAGKPAHCPFCSAVIRKNHLREIFVSSVTATDSAREEELVQKYNEEREARLDAENRIRVLQADLDIARLELLRMQAQIDSTNIKPFTPHIDSGQYFSQTPVKDQQLSAITHLPLVLFQVCSVNGRYGLFSRRFSPDDDRYFHKVDSKIRYIRPFSSTDIGCIVLFSSHILIVYLFDSFSPLEYVLQGDSDENTQPPVPAVLCFDVQDASSFFVADTSGTVHMLNFYLDLKGTIPSGVSNPHTIIHRKDGGLVVANVFAISIINISTKIRQIKKVEKDTVCTNVSVFGTNMLISYRKQGGFMKFEVTGEYSRSFSPKIKQLKRWDNRIYENYLYIVDEEDNALSVMDVRDLQTVQTYKFKEKILDFSVDSLSTVIVTQNGLYCYKNT